jgi:hypothetical protein
MFCTDRNSTNRALGYLAALLVGLGFLSGCRIENKDPTYATEFGAEFIPLKVNSYRDYRVDTLNFNTLLPTELDSGHVWQRRVVRSRLDSTALYASFQIDVYQREDTASPWLLRQTDIEYLRFDGAYVVQEKGIQQQLLSFPFTNTTRWNINAFNAQSQTGAYTLLYKGLTADSIAEFEGVRDSTCLSSQIEAVSFRKRIGLVSRYSCIAQFVQNPALPCTPPVQNQTRQYRKWTLVGSGRLP